MKKKTNKKVVEVSRAIWIRNLVLRIVTNCCLLWKPTCWRNLLPLSS